MYRKFIQILTGENPKIINYKSEKIDTKIFSKVLKVIILFNISFTFIVPLTNKLNKN